MVVEVQLQDQDNQQLALVDQELVLIEVTREAFLQQRVILADHQTHLNLVQVQILMAHQVSALEAADPEAWAQTAQQVQEEMEEVERPLQ